MNFDNVVSYNRKLAEILMLYIYLNRIVVWINSLLGRVWYPYEFICIPFRRLRKDQEGYMDYHQTMLSWGFWLIVHLGSYLEADSNIN